MPIPCSRTVVIDTTFVNGKLQSIEFSRPLEIQVIMTYLREYLLVVFCRSRNQRNSSSQKALSMVRTRYRQK